MRNKVNNCIICSSKVDHFCKTYDKHYGVVDQYFDINKCVSCGLLFLNPMIDDIELFKLYPEEYYFETKVSTLRKYVKYLTIPISDFIFRIRARDLYAFPFKNKAVLDLGVGNGDSMLRIKGKGGIVEGIEINENLYKLCIFKGLNVKFGTLLEAKFPDSYFDYVRSNHSFEHITNPYETLVEITRILKSEGRLFIGVPNTDSFNFKFFKENWYYIGAPFHPYNYNVRNLTLLLQQFGYKIEKVDYNGNYQGLLGSIQILMNLKSKKPSDQGWFSNSFTKAIFQFLSKILNIFKIGDCIEITAIKLPS